MRPLIFEIPKHKVQYETGSGDNAIYGAGKKLDITLNPIERQGKIVEPHLLSDHRASGRLVGRTADARRWPGIDR